MISVSKNKQQIQGQLNSVKKIPFPTVLAAIQDQLTSLPITVSPLMSMKLCEWNAAVFFGTVNRIQLTRTPGHSFC